MNFKRLLILSAVGCSTLVTASAFASDMDETYSTPAAPVAQAAYAANLYIEGQLGYAQTQWKRSTYPDSDLKHLSWSKGNGGFVWGGDIGYAWTKNLALEVGGFYLPKAKVDGKVMSQGIYKDFRGDIKSWVGYGAIKFSVPLMDKVSLYAKAGIGYNHAKQEQYIAGDDVSVSNGAVGFVGGIGANYDFGNNVFGGIQYMRFAGDTKDGAIKNTNPSVWTVSIGYKFSM